jgi:hypothetical protein
MRCIFQMFEGIDLLVIHTPKGVQQQVLNLKPVHRQILYRTRPPEEAIQETMEVPLEACPACGGPLEDRATHEQVQVGIPEVRLVITRFRTESGYCRRCQKRVRSRHPRQVSSLSRVGSAFAGGPGLEGGEGEVGACLVRGPTLGVGSEAGCPDRGEATVHGLGQ